MEEVGPFRSLTLPSRAKLGQEPGPIRESLSLPTSPRGLAPADLRLRSYKMPPKLFTVERKRVGYLRR